jgi:hypothetical protein
VAAHPVEHGHKAPKPSALSCRLSAFGSWRREGQTAEHGELQ